MLKSMTGFGRYEITTNEYKISVEIKAVNHRYLDLSIKMPKRFNYFEAGIRNLLKNYVQRGKIDIYINFEDYTEEKVILKYNSSLAAEYVKYFTQIEEKFQVPNDIKVSTIAKCPDVITMEQTGDDEEHIWHILSDAIEEALKKFVETRAAEGENLKTDMLGKLDYMLALVEDIDKRYPDVVQLYRIRLEDKVKELLSDTSVIDENRIATEVTVFADKICVDEETVRLKSHIENTKNELISGGSVGRKLDFIAQEMNREANTILSKANDLEISDKAIALKTEIEKVREQIQNIE